MYGLERDVGIGASEFAEELRFGIWSRGGQALLHEHTLHKILDQESCSSATRESIIFTGLIGRKVRDTRMSPARLSSV